MGHVIMPHPNSFEVTTNLLNSENLKVAIAQLQFHYVIADLKIGEEHI